MCEPCAAFLAATSPVGRYHGELTFPVIALAAHSGHFADAVRRQKARPSLGFCQVVARYLIRAIPAPWWLYRAVAVPARPFQGTHLVECWSLALNQNGLQLLEQSTLSRRISFFQKHQKALGRAQRLARDTFCAPARAHNPNTRVRVLLIDNVVTTGSTLLQCSRALSEAGYEVRGALTIAFRP